jgi:hypothetical protein
MRNFRGSVCLWLVLAIAASAQTGGSFDLSHNVVAGGGGQSTGGSFSLDGTAGQGSAGTVSSGDSYHLRGGFWAFDALAPTAASVSISGRIRTANGQGIGNVRLVLTNARTGEALAAISSSFGYYRFEQITVGQTYTLTVNAKRFAFEPNTRTFTLLDELTNFDFTALQ